jgi:hypothetical protein
MAVDFPGGDSPDLNALIASIIADLEDRQKMGDKRTVGSFLEERLSHLVKSHLLNPTLKQELEAKLKDFKQRNITSLSSKDFTSFNALLKESLKDSGFEEKVISKIQMLQEALERCRNPSGTYPFKEVILELQDPSLKRKFIEFCSEYQIDPTCLLSELTTAQKESVLAFLKDELKKEQSKEFKSFSPKEAKVLLEQAGVAVSALKTKFATHQRDIPNFLHVNRHRLCVEGMSNFLPELLTIADTEEGVAQTLAVRSHHRGFPICQQVEVDILNPRSHYINVKFPGAPGAFTVSLQDVDVLFERIAYFCDFVQCSELQKERMMLILSFLCTQHVPNGCCAIFKSMLCAKLAERGFENFTIEPFPVHIDFTPIYNEDESIKPRCFHVDFHAVLEVAPDIKKDLRLPKEKISKALELEGLGPYGAFNVTASFDVDASKKNPEVVVTDYKIA